MYSGTLSGFAASAGSYASGLGTWTPTGSGPETRAFRFIYTLDPTTTNPAQSGTATIGFTWEAQNT